MVHFTVNDRSFAERSVDERMDREMTAGAVSLSGDAATAAAVNQGIFLFSRGVELPIRLNKLYVWGCLLLKTFISN